MCLMFWEPSEPGISSWKEGQMVNQVEHESLATGISKLEITQ